MNDLKFVRKCVQQDSVAWDEFLNKYSKLIYNYIYSILRIKGKYIPSDVLEDLYQEIIFTLIKDNYKKLRSFKAKNGCSLASWLRIITINFTTDYIRKSKQVVSLEEDIGEGENLKGILRDDSHLKLEEDILGEEKQKQLADCIEELTVDDKYFLEFYMREDMSFDSLKSILGLSRAALDMRKMRIVQRLKECFKKKGFLLDY